LEGGKQLGLDAFLESIGKTSLDSRPLETSRASIKLNNISMKINLKLIVETIIKDKHFMNSFI